MTTPERLLLAVRIILPLAVGAMVLGIWEFLVWYYRIPKFVLPPPSMIWRSLIDDFGTLAPSLG